MNPLDPLKKILLAQHVYFWILLPIYGVWVVIQTIGEQLEKFVKEQSSSRIKLFKRNLVQKEATIAQPLTPRLRHFYKVINQQADSILMTLFYEVEHTVGVDQNHANKRGSAS